MGLVESSVSPGCVHLKPCGAEDLLPGGSLTERPTGAGCCGEASGPPPVGGWASSQGLPECPQGVVAGFPRASNPRASGVGWGCGGAPSPVN